MMMKQVNFTEEEVNRAIEHYKFVEWNRLADGADMKIGSRSFTKGKSAENSVINRIITVERSNNAKNIKRKQITFERKRNRDPDDAAKRTITYRKYSKLQQTQMIKYEGKKFVKGDSDNDIVKEIKKQQRKREKRKERDKTRNSAIILSEFASGNIVIPSVRDDVLDEAAGAFSDAVTEGAGTVSESGVVYLADIVEAADAFSDAEGAVTRASARENAEQAVDAYLERETGGIHLTEETVADDTKDTKEAEAAQEQLFRVLTSERTQFFEKHPDTCNNTMAEITPMGPSKYFSDMVKDLMLPLTLDEEANLSTITNVNYRQCLDRKWLSTQVINKYLQGYLRNRDLHLCTTRAGRKRSHFFDHEFMNNAQAKKSFDYDVYQRYSYRVPGGDIFNLKYLFFPININNKHWACIIVFMEEKRIRYCDSLGAGRVSSRSSLRDDHETLKQRRQKQKYMMNWVLSYFKAEYKVKKLQDMPDEPDWNLETCIHPTDAPQQDNTNDCGAFICMFCEFILNDCALSFTQEQVIQGQWRKKIILRILSLNDSSSKIISNLTGDDLDTVEIVEQHSITKKPIRSTRYHGSMHEDAIYSCEDNIVIQVECPLTCQGCYGNPCTNNDLQKWKFNYMTTKHPLVKVAETDRKGKGVFAKKRIKKGTFISEYVGMPLDCTDTKTKNGNYVMKIGDVFLDAEAEDSYAGTINHGCEPNCTVQKWTVDEEIRAKVTALNDIGKGDELTFDYNWRRTDSKCYCGALQCKGYM